MKKVVALLSGKEGKQGKEEVQIGILISELEKCVNGGTLKGIVEADDDLGPYWGWRHTEATIGRRLAIALLSQDMDCYRFSFLEKDIYGLSREETEKRINGVLSEIIERIGKSQKESFPMRLIGKD